MIKQMGQHINNWWILVDIIWIFCMLFLYLFFRQKHNRLCNKYVMNYVIDNNDVTKKNSGWFFWPRKNYSSFSDLEISVATTLKEVYAASEEGWANHSILLRALSARTTHHRQGPRDSRVTDEDLQMVSPKSSFLGFKGEGSFLCLSPRNIQRTLVAILKEISFKLPGFSYSASLLHRSGRRGAVRPILRVTFENSFRDSSLSLWNVWVLSPIVFLLAFRLLLN